MLKYLRGGLGGPPIFVACQSISVVVIELWAVEAFCLTPVIACLFFVAVVLSVLKMQVSLETCVVCAASLHSKLCSVFHSWFGFCHQMAVTQMLTFADVHCL
jgi:uncharacterized membrane protein